MKVYPLLPAHRTKVYEKVTFFLWRGIFLIIHTHGISYDVCPCVNVIRECVIQQFLCTFCVLYYYPLFREKWKSRNETVIMHAISLYCVSRLKAWLYMTRTAKKHRKFVMGYSRHELRSHLDSQTYIKTKGYLMA